MSLPGSDPTSMQCLIPFDQTLWMPTGSKLPHPSGRIPLGRGSDLTQSVPTKSGLPIILTQPENDIFVCFPAPPTRVGMNSLRGGDGHTHPMSVPGPYPTSKRSFRSFDQAVWAPTGNKQTPPSQ